MFKSGRSSNKNQPRQSENVNEQKELEFEVSVSELLKNQEWEELELKSVDRLDSTKGKSPKGFFYLGIALYKMTFYEQACRAF